MRRVMVAVAFLCGCSGPAEKHIEHKPPPPPPPPHETTLPVMGGTSHHPHAHLSPHEPGDHHHHHHPHPHLAGPGGHHHPY